MADLIERLQREATVYAHDSITRKLMTDSAAALEAAREDGARLDALHTVGLCLWHHRGRLMVNGWNHAMHRAQLGPALSEGSFARAFGDDDTLMEKQMALLNRVHA